MKIFSGSANKPLAEEITAFLNTKLSPVEIFIFPDGERRIRIVENVVEEDTVVIQSTATPVDTNYMELFLIIDGLKRSGAKSVTAVVPYMGYQRQDHIFRDGEAVSLEVIIEIVQKIGVTHFVGWDMHSVKIPDMFVIPVTHLSAMGLFAQKIKEETWHDKNTVLVSPDMGGIARIQKLSDMLDGMPFAAVEKNRDLETGLLDVTKLGEGSVTGKKRAIIVDDMIASGGTIITSCEVLKKLGIEDIVVMATHAVFSKDAPEKLETSFVKKIYVTDTVALPKEKMFKKLEILSMAKETAKAIKDIYTK